MQHEAYYIVNSLSSLYYIYMDYDLKKLGRLIKVERVRNDFSQEELAEKAGVSMRTISLIESGLQHPKFFLVVKLADVLNFDINILRQ